MKAFCPLVLVSALLLAGCNDRSAQQTPAPPDEKEIEQRVQQRLAEERRADAERQAHEREQQLAERERQLNEREQQLQARQQATPEPIEVPASAPPVVTERAEPAESFQIFYDSLAPHGAWIELSNYGYVWQPRVALQNPRWRPYTVGHWAYTDYGWTWISDEPWGWATYHYGRWARLRRLGWVWVPGEDWAPAWVSWRYGDRFVGWAALPPEARFDGAGGIHEWADQHFDIAAGDYVFVPASEFGDDELSAVAVPTEQNVTIFSDTTNVTNIVENNAIIINNGPNFALVNSRARKPIAQLRVERMTDSRDRGHKPEIRGQTIQVVAPHIKKAKTAAKPAQVTARTEDTKANGNPAPALAQPVQAIVAPSPMRAPQAPIVNQTPFTSGASLQEQQRAEREQKLGLQRAAAEQLRQQREQAAQAAQQARSKNSIQSPAPAQNDAAPPQPGPSPRRPQRRVPVEGQPLIASPAPVQSGEIISQPTLPPGRLQRRAPAAVQPQPTAAPQGDGRQPRRTRAVPAPSASPAP